MFEVEAKVPISRREFQQLSSRLQKEAHHLGNRSYTDTYYAKPKTAYIRIRKGEGEYDFDIKRRQTIKGIESNIEMEWGINDISGWRALLKRSGITPTIRKIKKSSLFKQNDFIIELNHVRLLGYYLEIERVVKNQKEVAKAKSDLVQMFKTLGYSQKQFEPRPYLELLENV